MLEPETYTAMINTMKRDCRVLESFKIMDYSLLVGVHNLDLAAKVGFPLDVEESSEELLRQLCYAIKNQLGHPNPTKPPQ